MSGAPPSPAAPPARSRATQELLAQPTRLGTARPLTAASWSPDRCRYIAAPRAAALIDAGLDPFCGAPVVPGTAWCPAHYRLCYCPRRRT